MYHRERRPLHLFLHLTPTPIYVSSGARRSLNVHVRVVSVAKLFFLGGGAASCSFCWCTTNAFLFNCAQTQLTDQHSHSCQLKLFLTRWSTDVDFLLMTKSKGLNNQSINERLRGNRHYSLQLLHINKKPQSLELRRHINCHT